MSAGKLKIVIEAQNLQIYFDRFTGAEITTGGDVNSTEVTLSYHDGLGYSFAQDEVLYQEGSIGSGNNDYFQLRSKNDIVCTQDGTMEVILEMQTNDPAGSYYYSPTIAGSPTFSFEVVLV